MQIITLLNEKGGVGKTTISTHLAAGLAIRGRRVILVDADPQGHASFSLGLEKQGGLFDLLVRDASFKDVLQTPDPLRVTTPDEAMKGQLYVIPSNIETRAIPNLIEDVSLLATRFDDLRNVIDVVIFDTPPTPSLLHSSIYLATDVIIYPTTCELLSFDGLASSINRRQQFQPMRQQLNRRPIEILGIIPTMYQGNTALHNHNLNMLMEQFGKKVWPPIPLRTVWREASNNRCMVYALAPTSKAASDAWSLVNKVEEEMAVWQRNG